MALTDPVPSQAIDVFKRNMEDSDRFVNQTSGTVTNRTGKTMRPLPVISDDIEQQLTDLTADVQDIDTFNTSNSDTFIDNVGTEKKTIKGIENDARIRVSQVMTDLGISGIKVLIQLSTDPLPNPLEYGEGQPLKFEDTLDEFTLIDGAWVENGNVGDEVDVTAASHLTLAQAQASDLRVGQYVRLTDFDISAYEVVDSTDSGGQYKVNILGDKKLKSVRDGKAWSVNAFSGNSDSQRLQNALAAGEAVYVPTDREYIIDEVDMPDADTYIYGNRSRIRSNAGTHALLQTHSGHKSTIHGLDFYGNSTAFNFQAQGTLPISTSGHEHDIAHCNFHEAAGVPKIILRGSREGVIAFCEFRGNAGIEREFAINTQIDHCKWASCDYMVNDLLGSEGLILVNPVALGGSYGVYGRRSTGIQIVAAMIDYVDAPLVFAGCTDVEMLGGYVSTRTEAAALDVRAYSGDGFQGYNHSYLGTKFRTNDVNGPRVVSLKDAYQIDLLKCYILNQGSNSNGIEYGGLTNSTISVTQRIRAGATNTTSIRALTGQDDATVKIRSSNIHSGSPIVREFFNEKDVSGWLTESRGEAIITTGNSSVVVNHGLSITPNKLDITLTPTTPNTQNLGYYVSAVTSTTFTLTLTGTVASTTAFAWKHSRY